jgi:hypothetical protein
MGGESLGEEHDQKARRLAASARYFPLPLSTQVGGVPTPRPVSHAHDECQMRSWDERENQVVPADLLG